MLNEQDLKYIRKNLELETNWLNKVSFLKLCLLFKSQTNINYVKDVFNSIEFDFFNLLKTNYYQQDLLSSNESFELLTSDRELISLIFKENFFLEILNTKFYEIFLLGSIRNERNENLLEIVKILRKNGHLIEASTLYSQTENFFSSYKSFSSSFAMLENSNK